MDFNTYIQTKLPTYSKIFGQTNVSAEDKEQAARELVGFHYPFLQQNSDTFPRLTQDQLKQLKLAGFVGWAVKPLPEGMTPADMLKQQVKEKLNVDLGSNYICLHFYLGLVGSTEYAIFELPTA